MTDDRLWWVVGIDVYQELERCIDDKDFHYYAYELDEDFQCFLEQLWAMREGLA